MGPAATTGRFGSGDVEGGVFGTWIAGVFSVGFWIWIARGRCADDIWDPKHRSQERIEWTGNTTCDERARIFRFGHLAHDISSGLAWRAQVDSFVSPLVRLLDIGIASRSTCQWRKSECEHGQNAVEPDRCGRQGREKGSFGSVEFS